VLLAAGLGLVLTSTLFSSLAMDSMRVWKRADSWILRCCRQPKQRQQTVAMLLVSHRNRGTG
jgi:hypothetical protein